MAEAKHLLGCGVPASKVANQVSGIRNMQQLYNWTSQIRRKDVSKQDSPWSGLLRMTWSNDGDAAYVKGLHSSSDGQVSAWLYSDSQLLKLSSQAGVGNPISIDTTFGDCAYVTFLACADLRLARKDTGTNPTFIGPAMLHSKERDPEALKGFLLHLKSLLPELQPVFCSDQDSMILHRVKEVWPDCVQVLGREHLLMNLADKCRSLGMTLATQNSIKADVFGPSAAADRPSLLDADTIEAFDRRLEEYLRVWEKIAPPAFLKWIRVRLVFLICNYGDAYDILYNY
jgi:hypothetical protein